MNTETLFITRKRKKWKFAHFAMWENCFAQDQVLPTLWETYFAVKGSLCVEVGAGTADVSVAMALRYPNRNFVAIDVKADRLYTGAKAARQYGLKNIAFVRAHIAALPTLFSENSIKELWITFPDPFPRNRQAKHRLTHPTFLQTYRKLLEGHGMVQFKTDNRPLFLWSLEQFVAHNWRIAQLHFDLHKSTLPDEYKITTAYERRYIDAGVPINFVQVKP